jgi:hypothetical protein
MGEMRTAFSNELNENGIFDELSETGLFSWVGWGRLFRID